VGQAEADALITLPTGGGAVRSIGETFQPDLQTGTGRARIPFDVPAGRAGLQPDLTLAYDSAAGNGPFGLGWSLALPRVARETAHGLPRYDDSDTFLLSGAERLVAVPDGPGLPAAAQRYRPAAEGLFARILRRRETVGVRRADYWDVWTQDGRRSRYGSAPPADVTAAWRDPAAVSSPDDHARVFAWLLSETVDAWGNRVEYAYERDGEALYLSGIRYVNDGDGRFLVHIELRYEQRTDVVTDRRAGFEVRTGKRCIGIDSSTWHDNQPVLARTLRLGYLNADGNGVSLLRRVELEGSDGPSVQAMPPLDFGAGPPTGRPVRRRTARRAPAQRHRSLLAQPWRRPVRRAADDA
jgi:Salmonella virulence plasmid 65kDa B protein